MNDTVINTTEQSEDLYAYIDYLEQSNVDLERKVTEAQTEARNLRRSVAAYKANATRRAMVRG